MCRWNQKICTTFAAGVAVRLLLHTHHLAHGLGRCCGAAVCSTSVYVPSQRGRSGFDSGMEWYVSTQRVGDFLYNLSYQEFIWQQQLRSRCVIEA